MLSPLFAQLSRMTGTAVLSPSAVEDDPPLRNADGQSNMEDAHQAVRPAVEQQVVPAVPPVVPQSVSKEQPMWRRAAVGCAPSNATAADILVADCVHNVQCHRHLHLRKHTDHSR